MSLILLAGTSGSVVGLTTIGPNTLSRVLAAALIARMVSFPRALAAGIAIGVVEAVIKYNTPTQSRDLRRPPVRRRPGRDVAHRPHAPTATTTRRSRSRLASKPIPERLRDIWWVRTLPRLIGVAAIAHRESPCTALHHRTRRASSSTRGCILFALIALSLVVLTGWSGQVSLGQAAFAGIGALGFAALVNGNPLGLGYGTHRVVIDLPKVPPALAVAIMTGACARSSPR